MSHSYQEIVSTLLALPKFGAGVGLHRHYDAIAVGVGQDMAKEIAIRAVRPLALDRQRFVGDGLLHGVRHRLPRRLVMKRRQMTHHVVEHLVAEIGE